VQIHVVAEKIVRVVSSVATVTVTGLVRKYHYWNYLFQLTISGTSMLILSLPGT
jgi:hypothetical protein